MEKEMNTALASHDNIELSIALDNVLEFMTVANHDESVSVGYHEVWLDKQDPCNVGWCWRRTGGGDERQIDDAGELIAALRDAGYLAD